MKTLKRFTQTIILIAIIFILCTQNILAATSGVGLRDSDEVTMEKYGKQLIGDANEINPNGTRYAGRVWTDKSVVANGKSFKADNSDSKTTSNNEGKAEITLTKNMDGVDENISTNEDFLHSFSAMSSTQVINEAVPVDVVLVLDVSSSMGATSDITETHEEAPKRPDDAERGTPVAKKYYKFTRIVKTLNQINSFIEKVMGNNPLNRIGVSVYGTSGTVLLPLGRYKVKNTTGNAYQEKLNNQFIQVSDFVWMNNSDSDPQDMAFKINTNVIPVKYSEEEDKDVETGETTDVIINNSDRYVGKDYPKTFPREGKNVGEYTDLQAGIATGFNMLASTNETQYHSKVTGGYENRIPVTLVFTDGGANTLPGYQGTGNNGTAWYKPELAVNYKEFEEGNTTEGGYLVRGNDATNLQVVCTQTLLNTSSLVSAIKKHYTHEDKPANFIAYTFGIDMDTNQDSFASPTLGLTLDPSQYYTNDPPLDNKHGIILGQDKAELVKETFNAMENWFKLDSSNAISSNIGKASFNLADKSMSIEYQNTKNGAVKKDKFKLLQEVSVSDKNIQVSIDEIHNNITYVPADHFYKVTSAEMDDILNNIVEELSGTAFTPISGVNDLGVSNALTYSDPIGLNLEVKNPCTSKSENTNSADSDMKMVLFGETHNVNRTAVYDYSFNLKYVTSQNIGKNEFPSGWYSSDSFTTKEDGTLQYDGTVVPTKNPFHIPIAGVGSVEEAWQKGWIYRLNWEDAITAIPTLNKVEGVTPDNLSEKQKNTIYTVYMVSEKDQLEVNKQNPAYGSAQTILDSTPGAYKLSEFRIWNEETGDFQDDGTEIANAGYDNALYVNIPSNAVPVQVATINYNIKGEPISYTTNIGYERNDEIENIEKYLKQSTPFRLFYSVGIDSKLLYKDGNVDVSQLEAGYVDTHTFSDASGENRYNDNGDYAGEIWFNSNYYTGDVVGNENNSDNSENDNPDAKNILTPENIAQTGLSKSIQNRDNLSAFETNTSTDVDTGSQGNSFVSFSPDLKNRYYLFQKNLILYQLSEEDKSTLEAQATDGKLPEIPVSKGSNTTRTGLTAQVSGIKTETTQILEINLNDGTKLNLNTINSTKNFNSNSYCYILVDYFELVSGSDKVNEVQLAIPRKASEFGSEITDDYAAYLCWFKPSDSTVEEETPVVKDTDAPANCILATKIDGFRTGNMNNNIQPKTSNPTLSAKNYFYPIPGLNNKSNEFTSDTILTYLGNNGIESIDDTRLLVTKQVAESNDTEQVAEPNNTDDSFEFQTFIDGLSGLKQAIVVQWDEFSNLWRQRVATIDANLNANNVLLSSDSQTPAVVDKSGKVISDPDNPEYTDKYFVCFPDKEITDSLVRVFTAQEASNDGKTLGKRYIYVNKDQLDEANKNKPEGVTYKEAQEPDLPAGTIQFLSSEAKLIPFSKVVDGDNDINDVQKTDIVNAETENSLVVATMRINNSYGLRSGVTITSDFATKSSYLTKNIYFGSKTVNDNGLVSQGALLTKDDSYDPNEYTTLNSNGSLRAGSQYITSDNLAENTAQYTLKDNEGLLFTGIRSDAQFRTTEKLTKPQYDHGYLLQQGRVVDQNSYEDYGLGDSSSPENCAKLNAYYTFKTENIDGSTSQPEEASPITNLNAYFTKGDADTPPYYSLFGKTGLYEEATHYSNVKNPGNLKIIKHLNTDSTNGENTNPDQEFKFTIELSNKNINGNYGDMTFVNGVAEIEVKANDKEGKTATGLPAGISYTVNEVEHSGYLVSWVTSNTGVIEKNDTVVVEATNTPTGQEKVENTPGDGQEVNVGDQITYTITAFNDSDEERTIVIKDPLHIGLDLVSASHDGQYNPGEKLPDGSSVDYDYSGIVTWTIPNVSPNTKESVTLTVKVNSNALAEKWVKNKAFVNFGNGWRETQEPQNPLTLGELKVSKELFGGDSSLRFKFELKLTSNEVPYTNKIRESGVGSVTPNDNGIVQFDLTAGSNVTFSEIPIGVKYELTEIPTEKYSVTWSQSSGIISNVPSRSTVTATNTYTGQEKIENYPGDGERVEVGNEIEYKITWRNTKPSLAHIIIVDPLDSGLDFVSASNGGSYNKNGVLPNDYTVDYGYTGTVIWDLGIQPGGASGYVTFKAVVNNKALNNTEVDNQAFVGVDNIYYKTDEPRNPLNPGKEEIDPGNGESVNVGQIITYRIFYSNPGSQTANVYIDDPLDYRVDFVEASDNGVYNPDAQPQLDKWTGTYQCHGVVNWEIPNVSPGQIGAVTLKVKVNRNAVHNDIIYDQAGYYIQDGPYINTEVLENPVNDNSKEEVSPGDKMGVEVGDYITYQINYTNDSDTPADITIKDPLDVGLDFIEASDDGVYNSAELIDVATGWNGGYQYLGVVTWTIPQVSAHTSGHVTLTCEVNKKAQDQNIVYDQAVVQIGTEPWQNTYKPQNPLEEPAKSELTPGDGQTVGIGQEITYKINYKNDTGDTATIQIVDPLDLGLDFISASNGGTYDPNGTPPDESKWSGGYDYHGIVTWNINNVPNGTSGYVTLTVKTNNDALLDESIVFDQAAVKVGNKPWKQTNETENPVKVSSITLQKKVYSTDEDKYKDNDYHFSIILGDKSINGKYGDITFTNGVSNVTLKNENKLQILGLPPGTTFEIIEQDSLGYDIFWSTNFTDQIISGQKITGLIESVNQNFIFTCNNVIDGSHKIETMPGNGVSTLIGQTIDYIITWQNNGTVPQEITVIDPLSIGVDFVSASDGGTYDPNGVLPDGLTSDYEYRGTVTWNLGLQQPGAKGYVSITVRTNPNSLLTDGVLNGAIVETPDHFDQTEKPNNPFDNSKKTEVKPGDGQTVTIGETITYKIDWKNNSESPKDVVIEDPIDKGLTFYSATNGGTYNPTGALTNGVTPPYTYQGVVTWNLGTQPAGSSGSVYLTVVVNSEAFDKVDDQAQVKIGDNWYTTEMPENPLERPHKTEETPGDGMSVLVGDEITYQISYVNSQDTSATVTIVDPLDIGLDFISATDGGTYNSSNILPSGANTPNYTYKGYVYWELTDVPAHTSGVVTLKAKVNDKSEFQGIVHNTSLVKVDNGPWIFTEEMKNPISGPAVSIEKTQAVNDGAQTKDQVLVKGGDELTYYLTVKNNSATEANGVKVQDEIPQTPIPLTLVEGSIDNNGTLDGTIINWDLGTLNSGETRVLSFSVKVPDGITTGTWINMATLDWDENPGEPVDSNKVVASTNNLYILKQQEVGDSGRTTDYLEVKEGDIITYYITIYNSGDTPIKDVVITDPVPDGLTVVDGSFTDNGYLDGNTLKWVIPELSPGISQTVEVKFSCVTPQVTSERYFKNIAYANGNPSNEVVSGGPEILYSSGAAGDMNSSGVTNPSGSNTGTMQQQTANSPNTTNTATPNTSTSSSTTQTGVSPKTGLDEAMNYVLAGVIVLGIAVLIYRCWRNYKSNLRD